MLGKLLKNEFKSTYKVMCAVYAAYFLITVLGSITSYLLGSGQSEANFLTVSVIVFYVLSTVALFVATFVYICIRYFKTMYSAQGYLTHTLPVKGISIFNAKLIVSEIWMIISAVLLMLSVFFFANAASGGEVWRELTRYSWTEFTRRFYEEAGISFIGMILWVKLGVFLGMLIMNLWIFASFAIGQLFDNHKVAMSVFSGMVLYFAFQIVGLIELFSLAGTKKGINISFGTLEFEMFMNSSMLISTISSVIFSAILYCVCVFINKRKLNLE